MLLSLDPGVVNVFREIFSRIIGVMDLKISVLVFSL